MTKAKAKVDVAKVTLTVEVEVPQDGFSDVEDIAMWLAYDGSTDLEEALAEAIRKWMPWQTERPDLVSVLITKAVQPGKARA